MGKPRILLFGRTGAGKSTVANMLARGHLDPPLLFQTSSGARGATLNMQTEECEDMVIVDTVGLGESDRGSVSHQEAKNILYNFFLQVTDGFHHFAFVRKWGKNDALDEQLWGLFRQAFKGAEQNFVVIFTHVGKPQEKELEKPETKEVLLKFYHPCQQWIFVNFRGQGKKALSRSLTNLQVKLSGIRGPVVAPEVCKHLTLGRILLVGRREKVKRILANLLVNDGNLEIIQRPEPADIGHLQIKDGRRWQVVEVPALWDLDYLPEDQLMVAQMVQRLILAAQRGFSHAVFVHESRHRHDQDDRVDKLLWKTMLLVFNGVIRNDRFMVVIAGDSQQAISSSRAMAESSLFPGSQKVVHLDLPLMQLSQYSSGVSTSSLNAGRLHTALQIFEHALQINDADTQSTLFHLEMLPTTHVNRLVEGAFRIEDTTPSLGLVLREFNSPLSNLSREYRKIVNKSDVSVQIQKCLTWKEKHEGNMNVDPDFCESSQLVIGERCNFRYLTMKCMDGSPVQGIVVTVEYKDKSELDIDSNLKAFELEEGNVISEAQLAVLAPDSHTQIGKRISVYTNHILMDERLGIRDTIREPLFVKNIQAHHEIALFLHSQPGWWCSYTFYASLRLIRT